MAEIFTLKINTVRLIILLSIAGFLGKAVIHPPHDFRRNQRRNVEKNFSLRWLVDAIQNIISPKIQKEIPIIGFMHGAGERGTDNERQLIHGKKWLMDNNLSYPAVVVLPQCPTEDYWSSVDPAIPMQKVTVNLFQQ